MRIGDTVRLTGIPPGLSEGELRTRTIFELCIGRVFSVTNVQENLIELLVGSVVGEHGLHALHLY